MYNVGQAINSDQAMRLAIETAKLGRGFVSPNPLVGCVIVDRDHNFLSMGAHLKYGDPHAEINAIQSIKDSKKLEGASVYVTLEPCAHQGKTGSCAEALAKLPIRKVYYGVQDPNPLVAGKGIEILRAHNKLVGHFDKYEGQCKEVCEQFSYHIVNKRPYISMKLGTSLDGKIALKSGESRWITGEQARTHSRQLRAHYDATLIGAGTLQYDNPTLDFRGTSFENKKDNKIIILDPKGKSAESFKESKLYKTHGAKNMFVLTRSEHIAAWSKNLVHIVEWEASQAGWQRALKNLYQKNIFSIYAEGGSFAFGQILTHELAQKLYMFQSPKILGNGLSWSQHFENKKLADAPILKNWQSLTLAEDRLNVAYF